MKRVSPRRLCSVITKLCTYCNRRRIGGEGAAKVSSLPTLSSSRCSYHIIVKFAEKNFHKGKYLWKAIKIVEIWKRNSRLLLPESPVQAEYARILSSRVSYTYSWVGNCVFEFQNGMHACMHACMCVCVLFLRWIWWMRCDVFLHYIREIAAGDMTTYII